MEPAPSRRRAVRLAAGAVAVVVLAGACGGGRSQSALSPGGLGARRVDSLWWLLFWISTAVFAVVLAFLGWALARRRRPDAKVRGTDAMRFVVIFGIGLPFAILAVAYGAGLRDQSALGAPPRPATVTVDVTGHIWWWEVRYPDQDVVTANEIHIPVGTPVKVELTTADVNHSFWVPALMPKTDMVAGRVNETWLQAYRPGTYRGQCAEYCGLQHANMAFQVIAQPQADFDAWLRARQGPVSRATTAAAQRGLRVFEQSACASCHTVRGTTAHGKVGPDLSDLASRDTIGAGAAPNDRGHLAGWIVNSQTTKPGNKMPPQPLGSRDLQDLLAYLETLR